MIPRVVGLGLLIALIAPSAAPVSASTAGTPDERFGRRGVASVNLRGWDAARRIAVAPDGRIVLAGIAGEEFERLAVVRFTKRGKLDRSFNGTGKRVMSLGTFVGFWGVGLGVARDGSVVVAGTVAERHADDAPVWTVRVVVVKLRPNGRLDRRFGDRGRFVTQPFEVSPLDEGTADLAVLDDGSIIVLAAVGKAAFVAFPSATALIKITPEGGLDASFGAGGIAPLGYVGALPGVTGLAVQPDGRILVGSTLYEGGLAWNTPLRSAEDFLVQRFMPDGSPDTSFGTGGAVRIDSGRGEWMWGLTLQRDGKILAFGQTDGDVNWDSRIARLTPDGDLDPSFGAGGMRVYEFDDSSSVRGLVERGRGLYALMNMYGYFAIIRLHRDGRIDRSFGWRGLAYVRLEAAMSLAATKRRLLPAGARWCSDNHCPHAMAVAAIRY